MGAAMATSAFMRIGNALVAGVLCSPLHALLDRRTALLTITGRRTGRRFRFPVEYSRDGHVVHVVSRADHRWWRNLVGGGHLTIRLGGVDYHAFGEVRELAEADRIRFLQGFWRDAYGRRLDTDDAAERARTAVIVRILLADD
ncbi:MAG: nitroreductase/quinone reductase family protein [Xanthobacteraceae bacterium]